jgi:DNA-binding beta-propeller fold protein YncE
MVTTGRGRLTVLVTAALVALAIAAAGAFGAFGDLTFQGCIEDNAIAAGDRECAATVPALNGARGVAESGRGAYVASFLDNAVVVLNRNEAGGGLTPKYCFKDGARPGECRTRNFGGLEGANSAYVPNDLQTLFVTAEVDNAVTPFNVHTPSGSLFHRDCIEDVESGGGDCPRQTAGLDGASSTAAYGDSAYVASRGDDALVRLDRDLHSSEIRPHSCVEDSPRDEGCDLHQPGLDGARSVAIPRRGRSVYVAASTDDSIVHFPREQRTGKLSKGSCIGDTGTTSCGQTAPGLDGAHRVAVSYDETSVYVVSETDDAIVHFARNPAGGGLSFRGCIEDVDDVDVEDRECAATAQGLDGPRGLAVSYDGRSVYTTSYLDHAVAMFVRDPLTGDLSPQGCITSTPSAACGASAPGISRPNAITGGFDDGTAYVAGFDDDAIVHFSRDEISGRLSPAG